MADRISVRRGRFEIGQKEPAVDQVVDESVGLFTVVPGIDQCPNQLAGGGIAGGEMLEQAGQGLAGAEVTHVVPNDTVFRRPELDKAQPSADPPDGRVGAQEQPAAYARVLTQGLDNRCQVSGVEACSAS